MKKFVFIFILLLFSGCFSTEKKEKVKITEPTEIASFITEISDTEENRLNNINLCVKTLNGKVISPDEEFSFNNTIGKRTEEKGYREAKILVSGETEYGVGGGICQVSTTLYNAALLAGFEILERHSHEGDVSYIAEGKDAAICFGTQDLKFKNTLSHSVKISADVKYNQIYIRIMKI